MPKYFPLVTTRTVVVEVPVGSEGEVLNERLIYENRSFAKKATDSVASVLISSEQAKRAQEFVTAAFAAEIQEFNKKSVEFVTAEVSVSDIAHRAVDSVEVVGVIQEMNQRAVDTIEAVIIPTADEAKRAVEDVSNTVTATANEIGQRADDSVEVVAVVQEINQKADDTIVVDVILQEVAKKAVEDVSNTVTATANELAKKAIDSVEAAIIARTDINQKATDTEVVQVSFNGYANAVVANTGWTNPNNALGNTTGTATTLTATASGVLGTTNNTTNGTITLDFRDVNLGDLDVTSVIVRCELQRANAGVAIAQPTSNIQFQYSLDGTNYTTFYTLTAVVAKSIQQIDVTALVGQNKAFFNTFRIRATGSITSGTGVGAASTASFFRTWFSVSANKTYL